jgi:hypothetical protein
MKTNEFREKRHVSRKTKTENKRKNKEKKLQYKQLDLIGKLE